MVASGRAQGEEPARVESDVPTVHAVPVRETGVIVALVRLPPERVVEVDCRRRWLSSPPLRAPARPGRRSRTPCAPSLGSGPVSMPWRASTPASPEHCGACARRARPARGCSPCLVRRHAAFPGRDHRQLRPQVKPNRPFGCQPAYVPVEPSTPEAVTRTSDDGRLRPETAAESHNEALPHTRSFALPSTTLGGGASPPTGDQDTHWKRQRVNAAKGYGFIEPVDGSNDVFGRVSAVERAGLGTLREGQPVTFGTRTGRDGPLSAENFSVVGATTDDANQAPPNTALQSGTVKWFNAAKSSTQGPSSGRDSEPSAKGRRYGSRPAPLAMAGCGARPSRSPTDAGP